MEPFDYHFCISTSLDYSKVQLIIIMIIIIINIIIYFVRLVGVRA